MPQLRPRRELFCRNIIRSAKNGATIAKCYEDAGYRTSGHASEVGGSRLMSSDEVKQRLNELARPAMKKMAFTLESLSAEVAETIVAAKAKGSHSTVLRAIELGARLHGLLRERVDITHDFGGTRAEVLARIAARYGEEAANVLTELLGEPEKPMIELRAKVVERKVDETSAELTAGLAKD
jgi:hypothetical protein